MTRISKLFVLFAAAISLSLVANAAPQPLPAPAGLLQSYGHGYGPGPRITCSSNNGKRNFCNADTRGGVRMVRQISGSACIQGQTWGYDRNSIWVDRGCRAEFVLGSGGPPPARIITCSSNDGRRNWCSVRPGADVRLSRQISGSPCDRGRTWGVDQRGIWVDRGCRADFSVR
jgi:hypothetical protein